MYDAGLLCRLPTDRLFAKTFTLCRFAESVRSRFWDIAEVRYNGVMTVEGIDTQHEPHVHASRRLVVGVGAVLVVAALGSVWVLWGEAFLKRCGIASCPFKDAPVERRFKLPPGAFDTPPREPQQPDIVEVQP